MKRIFCLIQTVVILITLTACQTKNNISNNIESNADYTTSCTKDYVDEFISIIGKLELGDLTSGTKLEKEHCYNVTPLCVCAQTDIKIFKFSDSCLSLALIDGEVYSVCDSFGGYGFVNAVPWDYDEDGNLDLLVASSWGSGLHRSVISVFNTTTKESILVYDTLNTEDPSVDLVVEAVPLASSLKESQDLPIYYQVFTAKIEAKDNNLADLSYTTTGVVGSVVVENTTPVFKYNS
ncbi:MAG: hypothetical protein IKU52_03215 [Clostridia bacterium]|nr:hypothetical protein [Clostridia bacterium]